MVNYNPITSRKMGFENCIGNCSNKIWLLYDTPLIVNVLSDDIQALHYELNHPLLPSTMVVTCVYAKCSRSERVPLWDLLRPFSSTTLPWIAGGDFNIITSSSEREGGANPDHQAM